MTAMATSVLESAGREVSVGLDRVKEAVERKTRVQLELPPRSMGRLTHLKEVTEAASYAEVVRNAIRLYEAMVNEVSAGREFLIKDKSGTITPYKVFLEP